MIFEVTMASKKEKLAKSGIALIIGIIVNALWISIPLIRGQQLISDLYSSVETEVIPSSMYFQTYSIKGYYGNIFSVKLSDKFDILPLSERYQEIQRIMKRYETTREAVLTKYLFKYGMEIYAKNVNQLPITIAQTSNNRYEYESTNFLTINGKLYSPEDFISANSQYNKILFTPSIEVELILSKNQPYILAADSISYLISYENYNVKYNNDPELRKIYDQGYAYYLKEGASVLLLEIDGEFAKIQLTEPQWGKKIGEIGWIRKENIKSYPK